MNIVTADLILTALVLMALGIHMAKRTVFLVNAKLLYAVLLLLIFLPFPFYVLRFLEVSGGLAVASLLVIAAALAVLLYPLARMPRTLAVFNAGRDGTAKLLQSVLEKHGLLHEAAAPHHGEPLVLRPGVPFRPQAGWRFTLRERDAHFLVGGLFSPSIAVVNRVGGNHLTHVEAAFTEFKSALLSQKTSRTPPDAILLILVGAILLLATCGLALFPLLSGG